MSKKAFYILITCFFITLQVKAQNEFENGFVLKVGPAIPVFNFGQFELNDVYFPKDSYYYQGANVGFAGAIGHMYFLNKVNLGRKTKLGIDVSWLTVSAMTSNWTFRVERSGNNSNQDIYYEGSFKLSHLFLAPEVGPFISFSLGNESAVDLSLKLIPSFNLILGAYNVPVGSGSEGISGQKTNIRVAPAVYFRKKKFLVGLEMNLGNVSMDYHFFDKPPYQGQTTILYVDGKSQGLYQNSTMNASFLKFVIGVKL
jgi:hypothetical protein